MMDFTETCQAAVNHFGYQSQSMMAIEEMAELQKEICKHFRGKSNFYQIAEEIADVQIMLEQLIILHDCRDAVEEWKFAKLFRLKELMSDGKNTGSPSNYLCSEDWLSQLD